MNDKIAEKYFETRTMETREWDPIHLAEVNRQLDELERKCGRINPNKATREDVLDLIWRKEREE